FFYFVINGFFFFFSSRRRHTIFSRDWSSDVCSSDLIGDAEITAGLLLTKYAAAGHRASVIHMTAGEKGNPRMDHLAYRKQRIERSEERRVGKECRSRWAREH